MAFKNDVKGRLDLAGLHDVPDHIKMSTGSEADPESETVISPTPLVLGLSVGGATLGAVLMITLIAYVIKRHNNKKKIVALYQFDEGATCTKSEPPTRTSSPKLGRRTPGLGGQGTPGNPKSALLMRSLTVDMIPDFELPPERVQPRTAADKKVHQTALQFQHSIINSLSNDIQRMSTDSDDPDATPNTAGRLWFSLVYDAAVEELTVNLIKAKYLKPRDKGNSPRDPFVKLYLLPDERTCQESRVRKKTLSPKFNETFVFKVPNNEITSRTLRMSVYDVDRKRVRHSLGHVIIPLGDLDLTRGDIMWRDLEQLWQSTGSLGELNLSLCYSPATEKLRVSVLRARNLKKLEYGEDTGVYVRVQLKHGEKIHKTKRTESLCGTCEPVYNESFAFGVPSKQIDACSVVVTVMVNFVGRLGNHEEEYGRVVVGPFMYARGEELMHWQEMMAQPRNTVTRWHQLSHCQKQRQV